MQQKRRPTINTDRLEDEFCKKESDESNQSNRSQPKKENRKRLKSDACALKGSSTALPL